MLCTASRLASAEACVRILLRKAGAALAKQVHRVGSEEHEEQRKISRLNSIDKKLPRPRPLALTLIWLAASYPRLRSTFALVPRRFSVPMNAAVVGRGAEEDEEMEGNVMAEG